MAEGEVESHETATGYPPPPLGSAAGDTVGISAAAGGFAGVAAGFVWGGIGGRIAMRVIFLTSDDRVRGLTSDDGFEIGIISGATVFLLIFTTIIGGVAGLGYGLLRVVLRGPQWLVATGVAITLAAGVGGGMIVNDHGIDFVVLEPLSLTVGLFLFIPAAWGVSVVLLTERLLRVKKLFPHGEHMVDVRYGGRLASAAAWAALAVITTVGSIDLARDLASLT